MLLQLRLAVHKIEQWPKECDRLQKAIDAMKNVPNVLDQMRSKAKNCKAILMRAGQELGAKEGLVHEVKEGDPHFSAWAEGRMREAYRKLEPGPFADLTRQVIEAGCRAARETSRKQIPKPPTPCAHPRKPETPSSRPWAPAPWHARLRSARTH